MRHTHEHADGSVTEIHYWKDRSTGETSGFKFKDEPDNLKSRKEMLDKKSVSNYYGSQTSVTDE